MHAEKIRRFIPFHPIAFAVFPILSLYVNNADQLQLADVLVTMIVITLSSGLLWLLLALRVKNPNKSAILASIFFLVFFSYGLAFRAMKNSFDQLAFKGILPYINWHTGEYVWLVCETSLFLFALVLILSVKKDLLFVSRTLNIIAGGALFSVALNWGFVQASANNSSVGLFIRDWKRDISEFTATDQSLHKPGGLPDIYYIILDGYARSDILKKYYNVDNAGFLEQLQEYGFYIGENSHANYMWTDLSLNSTLNFEYLDAIPERIGQDTHNNLPAQVMIEENRVFRALRQHGYQIVAFADIYPVTDISTAEVYLSPFRWTMNGFQNEVLNKTPIPALANALALEDQFDIHRNRINYILDHLPETARLKGPKFVFAHILAPHPPFVLGPRGEAVEPDTPYSILDGSDFVAETSTRAYVEGYRDQALYITDRIQSVIGEILSNSSSPPVIILQSDHGPGSRLAKYSLTDSDLDERMSILNAIFFPDRYYADFYPGVTPVNSFRILLNHYLGLENSLLPDRSYFSTAEKPYTFFEVTDQLTR